MGLTIKWDITYKCNLCCEHCVNGIYLNKDSKEISFEEIKTIVDNINSTKKIDYIHLLGGEPSVRKDFQDICKFLNERCINFGFNTNALTLYKNKDVLKNEHLKSIVLSLEGPNEIINDSIRGKKVFSKVNENLNKLIEYKNQLKNKNSKITVNMVLTKQNHEYIEEMINYCENIGVDELSILALIELGNAQGKNLSLSFSEEVQAVTSIAKIINSKSLNLEITPKFVPSLATKYVKEVLKLDFPNIIQGCGAGTTLVFLDNEGNLHPCDMMRDYSWDRSLIKNSFKKIMSHKDFEEPFEKSESHNGYSNFYPCNKCEYLQKECVPCFKISSTNKIVNMKKCILFNQLIEEKLNAK